MSDDNIKGVRILDVIREDRIEGAVPKDFDNFRIYELVSKGVLKENYGRRRNQEDILYFDVTNTSDEFRSAYSELIEELEVTEIIPIKKQKRQAQTAIPGNIVTLLPLAGVYSTLNRAELRLVGHEFVTIISTPEGIRVEPVISAKTYPENMHVEVDTERLDEELFAKLSNELIELSRKENGLYEHKGTLSKDKGLQ